MAESNPVVGSSRNRKFGDIISSIPMLVRFLSPPEIPRTSSVPIYVVAQQAIKMVAKGSFILFSLYAKSMFWRGGKIVCTLEKC